MPSTPSSNEWGFYRYAGKEWLNPHDALEDATARGDRSPDIQFVMPAADRIDWTAEPAEALADLYRQRAQQLRDAYDYLILMYSGGSDSHQAMMAFVNAGIHLDEVRTCYPVQWADKVAGTVGRDHPLGHLYEYHQAVVPGLRTLSLRSPRTTIKVVDTTDAYAGDMTEWHEVLPVQHRVTGGVHGLFVANFRARIERELQRDATAKRTGVIYGVDKPPLGLSGRELFVSFPDHWRMGVSHLWVGSGLFEPVMFYWGDLRITCKQAHIIKRALEQDARLISDVDAHRRLIYPDWSWAYQEREGLHDSLLLRCAGDRVRAIAQERTRYYNNRYGGLGLSIEDDPAAVKRRLRFLFACESPPYLVGELHAVQRPGHLPKRA